MCTPPNTEHVHCTDLCLQVSLEKTMELFQAADKFGITRLKLICECRCVIVVVAIVVAVVVVLLGGRCSTHTHTHPYTCPHMCVSLRPCLLLWL